MHDLTCVVTSWRRPKYLKRALQSLVDAGIQNVTLTSSETCTAVRELGMKFAPKFAHFRHTAQRADLGMNEMWMRGLYYSPTRFIHILHDDDYMDPSFGKKLEDVILPQLRAGTAGFAVWCAKVFEGKRHTTDVIWLDKPAGVHLTEPFHKFVMDPKHLAVTPVCCVYDRRECINTLKEWDDRYEAFDKSFSNTQVAGNDLLLMIRHCEAFPNFLWLRDKLAICTSHPGSITATHYDGEGRKRLDRAYNTTRALVKSRWTFDTDREFKMLVGWAPGPTSNSRETRAMDSWTPAVDTGEVLPYVYQGRTSKESLGDDRAYACLHDIFDYLRQFAEPEDHLIYVNSDCGLVHNGGLLLRQALSTREVAYGWRRSLRRVPEGPVPLYRAGMEDEGSDLFAMRARWWDANRRYIPRLYVGCQGWDVVWRNVFDKWAETRGHHDAKVHNIVWHEIHLPAWSTNAMENNPTNRFNRGVSANWLRVHGRPRDAHDVLHCVIERDSAIVQQMLEEDKNKSCKLSPTTKT